MRDDSRHKDANRPYNWNLIGGIAAVAGVLVALLAWLSPTNPSEVKLPTPSTTPSLPTLESESSMTSQIQTPTKGTTTTVGPRSIRHAGRLVMLAGGRRADLDALPDDPQWRGGGTTTSDLMYDRGGFNSGWPDADILSVTGRQEPDCSQQTGYGKLRIKPADMLAAGNPWLCVETGEGRFSAVEVVSVEKDVQTGYYEKVALNVKTYN